MSSNMEDTMRRTILRPQHLTISHFLLPNKTLAFNIPSGRGATIERWSINPSISVTIWGMVMHGISEAILNVIGVFEIFQRRTTSSIVSALRTARLVLFNMPGMAQYKALGSLKIITEISCIFDSLGLNYFVSGGFACDMKIGRITRYHHDIDFSILKDDSVDRVYSDLARAGFAIVSKGNNCHVQKYGYAIDLFFWKESGTDWVENTLGDTMIRMPRSCFYHTTARLYGGIYKVASDEYLVCIDPFVKKPKSRAYISTLKSTTPIDCDCSLSKASQDVHLYEFRYIGQQEKTAACV
jgi:hypothetical protein